MKKLYKKKDGKKICGVCNGIAEYFTVDVTLVRIIWIIFAFLGGAGLLAYFICALVMPEQPKNDNVNGFKSEDKI